MHGRPIDVVDVNEAREALAKGYIIPVGQEEEAAVILGHDCGVTFVTKGCGFEFIRVLC